MFAEFKDFAVNAELALTLIFLLHRPCKYAIITLLK